MPQSGTCILQLPLRHAPSVAKEAAALDHLSGGRLVLGVGVGTHPGEFAAAGVAFGARGRLLDDGIDTLHRAWAQSAGARYAQLPAPGPIPVWVGGSSEAALRRAACRGDGWIPLFVPAAEYRAALGRLDKEAERAGRDPGAVARATVVFVSVGSAGADERGLAWMSSLYGLPARSFQRHLVTGSARSCASALARFAEAGAQHIAVFVTTDDPLVQFEDLAGEFAGLIASPSWRRERRVRLYRPLTARGSRNRLGGDVVVRQDVSIVGIGMTPMDRRDLTPADMAGQAVRAALADAGLSPGDVGLVISANALGGRLCDQGCIRGQSWLRDVDLGTTGVVNVDNSCAGGSSAMHLGWLAAQAGQSPVLVVGVEKMWTGQRGETIAGIEDGLPSDERAEIRVRLDNDAGSVLMALNAGWVRHQIDERGTTPEQIAAAAAKARRAGSRNPLAQFRTPVTVEEVLASPVVVAPLTRLMCSSFTDGAAAAVLSAGTAPGAPRIRASVLRSGNGELDYHDRLRETAEEAWKAAGAGPEDIDVVELHDATSAEELYALESLGFFPAGDAGLATLAGDTDVGGRGVCVNPSGGLVARGHPLGATGICQIAELVAQLRGTATGRQVHQPRLAAAVNTGGIMSGQRHRPRRRARPRAHLTPGAWSSRHRVGHRRTRQGRHQRGPLGAARHQ